MNENVKILFINYLDELFPNAKAELNFSNNFELLIAVVLSAQTTDVSVNKVTPKLFKKYPTPFDLSKADVNDVETIINSIGLYRNKSKNIIELSKILVEKYNGEIPNRREALESLPGVGRKTANVVLSNAFDVPAFAVDTHVERISKRLGIALENDSVLTVEEKLMALFPRQLWKKLHHQLIFFGRYHCTSKKPKCEICKMKDFCPFFQALNEKKMLD